MNSKHHNVCKPCTVEAPTSFQAPIDKPPRLFATKIDLTFFLGSLFKMKLHVEYLLQMELILLHIRCSVYIYVFVADEIAATSIVTCSVLSHTIQKSYTKGV